MQRVTFKPSHFNTPRSDAGRVVIVLSDGDQNQDCLNGDCQKTATDAAMLLKDGGATVFSWGFGTSSMDTLTGIASGASRVHAYTAHAHAHEHELHMHMHVPFPFHMHMHCHFHFHPEPPTLTPNPQPLICIPVPIIPGPPPLRSLTSSSLSPHLHLRLASR